MLEGGESFGIYLLWLGGGLKDENTMLSTHLISCVEDDSSLAGEPETSSIKPRPSSSGTSVLAASGIQ